MGTSEQEGPQNDDQMNPWGQESEAPLTRGIEFVPCTEGGVLIDHCCWNHLITNQRLRCLFSFSANDMYYFSAI